MFHGLGPALHHGLLPVESLISKKVKWQRWLPMWVFNANNDYQRQDWTKLKLIVTDFLQHKELCHFIPSALSFSQKFKSFQNQKLLHPRAAHPLLCLLHLRTYCLYTSSYSQVENSLSKLVKILFSILESWEVCQVNYSLLVLFRQTWWSFPTLSRDSEMLNDTFSFCRLFNSLRKGCDMVKKKKWLTHCDEFVWFRVYKAN